MKEFMIGGMLIYISTLMSMLNKSLVDLDSTDLRLDFGDTVIHCQYITYSSSKGSTKNWRMVVV